MKKQIANFIIEDGVFTIDDKDKVMFFIYNKDHILNTCDYLHMDFSLKRYCGKANMFEVFEEAEKHLKEFLGINKDFIDESEMMI